MLKKHFAGVSEQVDMQKAVSTGWCKESRSFILVTKPYTENFTVFVQRILLNFFDPAG